MEQNIRIDVQTIDDLDALSRLEASVLEADPFPAYLDLEHIYKREAELLGAVGRSDAALLARLRAAVMWHYTDHDDGFEFGRVLTGDALGAWRGAPPPFFAHLFERGTARDQPPPLRAAWLHSLWLMRELWPKPLPFPRIDLIRGLISSLIDAADWAADHVNQFESGFVFAHDYWNTATDVASSTNQRELICASAGRLRRIIELATSATPLWTMRMLDIEVDLAFDRKKRRDDIVTAQRLEEILGHLEKLLPSVQAHPEAWMEFQLLRLRERIERALGRPPSDQEAARRRADVHQREADRESSPMMRARALRNAGVEHQQAGSHHEAVALIEQSRRATQQATKTFHKVSTRISASHPEAEAWIEAVMKLGSALDILILLSLKYPGHSLQNGTTPEPPMSIADFLQQIPIEGDRMQMDLSPEEARRRRIDAFLASEINIWTALSLYPLLRRLREAARLSAEDVLAILFCSDFVDEVDRPFLELGLRHYFADDTLSAIHLLIPRIEQILRRLLRARGAESTAINGGDLREMSLGPLVQAGREAGVLPEPLARLFMLTFCDGINLRNDVCHGWVRADQCGALAADRTLHLLLLTAGLGLHFEDEQVPEPDR